MSDFRARSSAEVLDAAFEIYRRHFAIFLAIGVVGVLPFAILEYTALSMTGTFAHLGARSGAVGGAVMAVSPISPSTLMAMQGMLAVLYLVMLIVTPLAQATTISAAATAYRGEPTDLASAIRAAFARPFAVLLAYWARGIIIALVFGAAALVVGIVTAVLAALLKAVAIILIIPIGVALLTLMALVYARYVATLPVLLVERTRVGDALHRSARLTEGSLWRVALLVGGTALVAIVFSMVLGGIVGALASGLVGAVLYLFAAALAGQFAVVVATVLYFDLRIRKEGFDIELLASTLAPAPPAAAPQIPPSAATI